MVLGGSLKVYGFWFVYTRARTPVILPVAVSGCVDRCKVWLSTRLMHRFVKPNRLTLKCSCIRHRVVLTSRELLSVLMSSKEGENPLIIVQRASAEPRDRYERSLCLFVIILIVFLTLSLSYLTQGQSWLSITTLTVWAMKKQSANVVPQTAVDFLGTDQRQVICQEILTVSCLLALVFLGGTCWWTGFMLQ